MPACCRACPDGPFHTTFRWKPAAQTRESIMQKKDNAGGWTQFADLTLVPAVKK